MKIYALKDGEDVFYIGKTSNIKTRLSAHIRDSFKLLNRKDRKIQSMLAEGKKPDVSVIAECSAKESNILEERCIKKYLADGYNLLNGHFAFDKNLTETEVEVLLLLCQDKDARQISKEIHKSVRTIEAIRQHIKDKANVSTLVGLGVWAVKEGYVNL